MVERIHSICTEGQNPRRYRELGQLSETFQIRLKKGAESFTIPVPRKLMLWLKEVTERELKRMAGLAVIERVEEHGE